MQNKLEIKLVIKAQGLSQEDAEAYFLRLKDMITKCRVHGLCGQSGVTHFEVVKFNDLPVNDANAVKEGT